MNYIHEIQYIKIVSSHICDCGFIMCQEGLFAENQVKMLSPGRLLMQHNWCLLKKRAVWVQKGASDNRGRDWIVTAARSWAPSSEFSDSTQESALYRNPGKALCWGAFREPRPCCYLDFRFLTSETVPWEISPTPFCYASLLHQPWETDIIINS